MYSIIQIFGNESEVVLIADTAWTLRGEPEGLEGREAPGCPQDHPHPLHLRRGKKVVQSKYYILHQIMFWIP